MAEIPHVELDSNSVAEHVVLGGFSRVKSGHEVVWLPLTSFAKINGLSVHHEKGEQCCFNLATTAFANRIKRVWVMNDSAWSSVTRRPREPEDRAGGRFCTRRSDVVF